MHHTNRIMSTKCSFVDDHRGGYLDTCLVQRTICWHSNLERAIQPPPPIYSSASSSSSSSSSLVRHICSTTCACLAFRSHRGFCHTMWMPQGEVMLFPNLRLRVFANSIGHRRSIDLQYHKINNNNNVCEREE
jgi:hypothetical protein